MSLITLKKIGILLSRSPTGTTCAEVVPAGMPRRGPVMPSEEMSLIAASDESAGSEVTEPLALGLGCYLEC